MNALHERLTAGAGPEATSFSTDDIRRRVGQRARRRRLAAVGAAAILIVVAGLAGVVLRDAARPAEVVVVGEGADTPTTTTARLRHVLVTGTVQDEPWELIVQPPGGGALCVEVRLARGALRTCSAWEEVIAASAYDILGDRVIAGSTTPEVASARVRFADATESLVIPTVAADGYDRRFFAATITTDAPIAEVMAIDADGNDLEPVADLGGGALETGRAEG
jgi:hypothetical protein